MHAEQQESRFASKAASIEHVNGAKETFEEQITTYSIGMD